MTPTPFPTWPSFTHEEADAVRDVLLSNQVNYWTGQECRRFEQEFARWVGTEHAIALANGTVALDLALHALGVGPGDEVIVTPRTFIASISCVISAGATPVFADVDRDSGNLTAATIRQVLTPKTKAVILVHLAGWPCDMDPIMDLSAQHGFKVIEDCAQAHGAQYKGRSVGAIGHIGAWSFCQDKIITTGGEGGMVTTNSREFWSAMWSYKDHGKSWDGVYDRHHAPGFRWVIDSFGTNWRMLEMQGVIGRMQLHRIAEWTATRARHAHAILEACRAVHALRVPQFANHDGATRHAFYKCYAYVDPRALKPGWSRDTIVDTIHALGVPCFQGSCSEAYLEAAFDNTPWRPAQRLVNARELGETSLMFLVHPTLGDADITRTADAITKVMNAAAR